MSDSQPWLGRWVCVGGGTNGFGLALATEFALTGANVAIIGRDPSRGEQALKSIRAKLFDKKLDFPQQELLFFSVDLSRSENIEASDWHQWLAKTELAAAIAACGKSDRGYLTELSSDDLSGLWTANVTTSFVFSQSCVPALERASGCLVHVASLAGLLVRPGLGGYCLAKHAVVALSRQLRFELEKRTIRVLLVCPGPIQRSDTDQRYDELVNHRQLPEELRKAGGGTNLKAIDPIWLAQRIQQAIRRNETELVVPPKVRWLVCLRSLWPSAFDRFLNR
jgi:short-subunit dehydrogenase